MGRIVVGGPESDALEAALMSSALMASLVTRLRRRSERLGARALEVEANHRALVSGVVSLVLESRENPNAGAPVRIERGPHGEIALVWQDAPVAVPAEA